MARSLRVFNDGDCDDEDGPLKKTAFFSSLLFLATQLTACGIDTPEPRPPVDKKEGFLEGWFDAPDGTEFPAPDEVLLETGFGQTLPQKPRALVDPVFRPWASGRALAVHNDQLFVVDSDNDTLSVMDIASGKIARAIDVGPRPEQVVVDSQGNAYVTLRHGSAVVRIAAGSEVVTRSAKLGVEPFGLALSSDQQSLYVTLRGNGKLIVLNPSTLEKKGTLEGLNRPTIVATGSNGQVAVAQHPTAASSYAIVVWQTDGQGVPITITRNLRSLRSDLPYDALFHPQRPKHITSNRVRGMVFSPEDNSLLSAHMQTFTGTESDVLNGLINQIMTQDVGGPNGKNIKNPDKPGTGYGGHGIPSVTPHLLRPMVGAVTRLSAGSSYSAPDNAPLAAVKDAQTLEPLMHLVSQVTDINHHPFWSLALVTGMGSDNVLVLNTAALDPMASPLGIIEVGRAPKAVAFSTDGMHAYVLNGHSYTVSRVDLSPFFEMADTSGLPVGVGDLDEILGTLGAAGVHTDPIRVKHDRWAAFGADPLDAQLSEGRRIYTFTRSQKISHGGKFACASCHFEGEEDGLVWFIPGGVRQTPALAGRLADTAPFNWGGSEDVLQDNMAKTIDRMGGEGFSSSELKALEAYLLYGLIQPPNPHLVDGGLTSAQKRGKAIFTSATAGCASCHSGENLTDGKNHDVGTLNNIEKNVLDMFGEFSIILDKEFEDSEEFEDLMASFTDKFNTPTLRDLHATAPYLHDGSAKDLMEVLDRTATTMGHTADLSLEQKEDLVAYLLTL
jgi:YVTN family beta-propeller protein